VQFAVFVEPIVTVTGRPDVEEAEKDVGVPTVTVVAWFSPLKEILCARPAGAGTQLSVISVVGPSV
jgi:hypothetical protein